MAEAEGYYYVWAAERLLVPVPPNQPWSRKNPLAYEPLTILSYVAAVTEKVRLGTSIMILPLRNPLILARQAATLDVFSDGRLTLGFGLGWMEEEFRAVGVPLKERASRTDEAILVLRELWESDRPEFKGRFTSFDETLFEPKPVQRRLPIWISGDTIPAIERVARLGDGWLTNIRDYEEMKSKIQVLRSAAEKNGRSIEDISVTYNFLLKDVNSERSSLLEAVEKFQAIGASQFIVSVYSTSDYVTQVRLFASQVMASL